MRKTTQEKALGALERGLKRFNGGRNWTRYAYQRQRTFYNPRRVERSFCGLGTIYYGTKDPDVRAVAVAALAAAINPENATSHPENIVMEFNDRCSTFKPVKSVFESAIASLR